MLVLETARPEDVNTEVTTWVIQEWNEFMPLTTHHAQAGTQLLTTYPAVDDNDAFRNKPGRGPIRRISTSGSVRRLLATTVWLPKFVTLILPHYWHRVKVERE
jgi:hypothetical protein